MQNLLKFYQSVLKIWSGKEILMIIKDHNYVVNLPKLMCKDPILELVEVNAYAKFDRIPSICLQDI